MNLKNMKVGQSIVISKTLDVDTSLKSLMQTVDDFFVVVRESLSSLYHIAHNLDIIQVRVHDCLDTIANNNMTKEPKLRSKFPKKMKLYSKLNNPDIELQAKKARTLYKNNLKGLIVRLNRFKMLNPNLKFNTKDIVIPLTKFEIFYRG